MGEIEWKWSLHAFLLVYKKWEHILSFMKFLREKNQSVEVKVFQEKKVAWHKGKLWAFKENEHHFFAFW